MNRQGSRSKEQQEVLDRLWKGLPVVDAKSDIRVFVAPEDGDNALPGDGQNCLLAQACKRQFGSTKVVFFSRVAYVELPDEKGHRRVERFRISASAHRLLRRYDETEEVETGGAFVMRAPSPSESLEGQRQYNKEYREATIKGERTKSKERTKRSKRGAKSRPILVGNHATRSGTGMVHFHNDHDLGVKAA